ncbi:MAG: Ig-like domain-containing protein [Gammaproteobacteria bacterium]
MKRSITGILALAFALGASGAAADELFDVASALRAEVLAAPVYPASAAHAQRGAVDTDGDGVADSADNCIVLSNAAQRDTDNDGIGNACDADFNQDCTVNVLDLGFLRSVFFSDDPDADLNGDGVVAITDLGILRSQFFSTPGPSGVANACVTSLTLSGVVPGARLDGGNLTATVDAGDEGGVVSFDTTLATNGSYEVTLLAPSGDGFVTLAVDGTSAQQPLRLQSLAGTVAALAQAGGNDGTVDNTQAASLDLHEISTSLAALVRERNGGPVSTDDQLNAAIGSVDGATLIDLASLLRVYLAFPELIPVANTLEVVESPPLREFLLDAFRSTNPDIIDIGALVAAETLRVDYPTTFPGGQIYFTRVGNLQGGGAGIIDLQPGGVADYRAGNASGLGTWTADGDGQLRIAFPTALVQDEFQITVEDPENPGEFIETTQLVLLEDVVIERVIDGVLADHVFVKPVVRTTVPDVPLIPDEVTLATSNRTTAELAFDGPNAFPASTADLSGTGQVLSFYHRDNASEGSFDVRRGVDTLDFNADGTGASRRRGFGFSWVVSADALDVTFSNGDVNRFEYLFDDYDGLASLIVRSDLVGEPTITSRSLMLGRDETQAFDLPQIENVRFRSDLATRSTATSTFRVFDFMFEPGGVACRNPGNAGSEWVYSLQDGRMDLLRTFTFDPLQFISRTWEPVQARADGYWVMETFQFGNDEPVVNPAVTPGRLNFYSIEQLLAGNLRPTLVPDQFDATLGTNVRIYFATLFLNDIDPEGDELVARDIDLVSANGGTVTSVFDPAGRLVAFDYAAPAGFTGLDTIEYRASDLFCFSDAVVTGVIDVTVSP